MYGNKEIKISEDIVLRRIIPIDAKAIFDTIDSQRPYLGQWLPFVERTKTISDTEEFINFTLNSPENLDIVYTIRYKNDFAGIIGFKNSDEINQSIEIGYWLSENLQGLGIMTRSVKTLCQLAFYTFKTNRIQIKCAVGNYKSATIPKRLNFKFEGIEREGELRNDGSYLDLEVYSLLKREL